jgi:hypothetical protein
LAWQTTRQLLIRIEIDLLEFLERDIDLEEELEEFEGEFEKDEVVKV